VPSRLSSLLVRDGLVGVKRMEKAFQRQVIYGGSLDTILLEMGLVSEDRLTQYLALASGLPPAARDEGAAIPDDALATIPKDLAEKHRALPLALVGEAVRILVCSPLELDELEDLADILDLPLQPLITPEYRWHLVFASAYGGEPPARFTTLARTLDAEAPAVPVGRGAAVIVDDKAAPSGGVAAAVRADPLAPTSPVPAPPVVAVAPVSSAAAVSRTTGGPVPVVSNRTSTPVTGAPAAVIAPISPHEDTLRMSTSEVEAAIGHELMEQHRAHSATLLGVEPNRAATDAAPPPPGTVVRRDGVPDNPLGNTSVIFESKRPRTMSPGPVSAVRPVARAETQPIEATNRDTPLPVVRARELLAAVDDRDVVFLTLLRAARSRARWAGLLTVQGGAAIGRVALAETGLDIAAIASVLIPLDVVSPFRTVVTSQQPHIGPLASGDAAIDAMLLRLGGSVPPSALVLPIVLRDRVVALVVAHRVHNDIKLIDVTELLPLAAATSDALGRLIVRHKAAGYRTPNEAVPVAVESDHVDTKRIARDDSSASWRRPEPADALVVDAADIASVVDGAEPVRAEAAAQPVERAPLPPIDDVLDVIETAKEGEAEQYIYDAVERSTDTLGALARRFPGKLRVDRFTVSGRALRAAQYGGLLELVVQLGSVAGELLVDKMSAPQRDVRFYATVCAAELRPRSAVYSLVERVFDQDYGVRGMAIEALAGYPVNDLGSAMVRTRRAVHSEDPEVVAAATSAITQLGDADAIGELIGAVEKTGRIGEHVRKALVALTAQDFGPSERRWRKWWESARGRHRVEWLIEGLGHKDDAIREAAISDLRRLTGEYFNYHHDLPKRDRDAAAAAWATWWRETGRRRFVLREDERHRPTALLPTTKRD
jgi:hypothetical protein